MRIEYLSDNISYAEIVAEWLYNEFFKGIRHGISYEKVLSSVKDCHKTELPVRLIAIEGNKCVGTVSIVQNDLKFRDYTPWLAALYVDNPFRRNGIGEQLIEGVKNTVKELGHNEVYLRTVHTSDYYRKLGWQFIESCEDEYGLKPDIFKVMLV
jgi:predicted N-acetyltransferase YhbS